MSGSALALPMLAMVAAAGCLLGGAVGWLWATFRERVRRERAVAEAERGRAIAETRVAEILARQGERNAALEAAERKLGDAFRALAADALRANNEGFLALAAEKLAGAHRQADDALAARQVAIETLVKPVKESLDQVGGHIRELERERGQAYGRLVEMVQHMGVAQERLRAETGNLTRALRAPAVRGRWGEVTLRRVVEIAGMVEHCDFVEQETLATDEGARLRPDLVVRLPGGRQVAVDAKVPLEAYLDALDVATEEERLPRLAQHAAQLRAHVLKLAGRTYWAELDGSPEFVVLFVPGEAMYSVALEQAPTLIEEAALKRVLIATPTTLIALLQTIRFGWRQERLAESAKQVSEQGQVLHERLATLVDHFCKLGVALGRATEHFNGAVASFEGRVLPAVRRLEELGAGSKKTPPELRQVESRPRTLAAMDETGSALAT